MTSKQRAYLRGLANTMEPIIHVGKDGVNENMVKQASDALEARELIKGTVLQNSRRKCLLMPGAKIGNRFVIYRAREKDPKIVLP